MEHKKDMSARSRGNSFVYAYNGLKTVMKEPNAILHAIATVCVVIAGFARHLDINRWIAIIFAIGLVWITETLNTAIEKICDHVCENKTHQAIKIIKDIAAAAVLLSAIASVVIGIIVFFF